MSISLPLPNTRTRPTSKNSDHCLECHNGYRQKIWCEEFKFFMTNMSKSTRKDIPIPIALRALFEGRDKNPVHESSPNPSLSKWTPPAVYPILRDRIPHFVRSRGPLSVISAALSMCRAVGALAFHIRISETTASPTLFSTFR